MDQTPTQDSKPKSAGAIVGLVLGIIALLTSFLPFINNFSAVLAVVGVVFAIVGLVGTLRNKKSGKGMAIAATIVNVLAFIIVLATQSSYSAAIKDATEGSISTSSVSAAASPDAVSDAAQTQQATPASEKYAIADEQLEKDSYTAKITGTFTNLTDKKLSYVQLSYTIFDADGAQIGTAYANTNNLDAGGTWKYEAAYFSSDTDEVASYKLSDVSGF